MSLPRSDARRISSNEGVPSDEFYVRLVMEWRLRMEDGGGGTSVSFREHLQAEFKPLERLWRRKEIGGVAQQGRPRKEEEMFLLLRLALC